MLLPRWTTARPLSGEVERLRRELKDREAELAKLRMELVSGSASVGSVLIPD